MCAPAQPAGITLLKPIFFPYKLDSRISRTLIPSVAATGSKFCGGATGFPRKREPRVALAAAAVQSFSLIRQPHRIPHTWLNMQRIRFCSPPALTTTERINAWLRDSANPESDAEVALSHPRPPKRRHSDLCPMERSRPQSPSKRPRVECDEPITPTQSASVVGSVTSLTEKTTLSMRSNASRSSSPQRQITQLRTARPPIFFYPLATAGECVPAAVAPRIRTLQTRLRHRLEREYIPACLRDALERDPTYKAALLFDPIEDTAYYDEEEVDAALVLDRVKAVFQGTHLCKQHTMDENAWCLHVVTPLLQLAIILYGRGRFRQESVYVSLFLTSVYTNNTDNRSLSSPPTSLLPPPPAPSPPPSSARPTSACPTHTSILCMPASTRPSVTPLSATLPTPTPRPPLSSLASKSSPPRETFKKHSCR